MMEYEDRFEITAEMLRRFFRYEISYSAFRPAELDEDAIDYAQYFIQWDDIEALLANLKEKDLLIGEVYEDWAMPVCHLIEADHLGLISAEEEARADVMRVSCMETPENPAEAMSYVILSIVQALGQIRWQHPEYLCTDIFDFNAMSRDIRLFEEEKYNDADPVMWSDEKKLFFLQKLCEYDVTEEELKENDLSAIRHFKRLEAVTEEEAGPIREIIEEMEKKGYRQATEAIAFCCYDDSWIYRYDIRRAHDLLLKLLTDDNNPDPYRKCIYATLLGNIYYRGLLDISLKRNEAQERQNRKKAFYFYSLGAVGDLAEAKECLKKMKEEKSLAHEAEDKVCEQDKISSSGKIGIALRQQGVGDE